MGTTNVLATLQKYLQNPKEIKITPDISSALGAFLEPLINEIFSGSIQVDGAAFSLTGTEAVATVQGTGSAPPLLQQIQATAKFTATSGGAEIDFSGVIESDLPVSSAWPSALNQYPFTQFTITGGTLTLDAKPGDSTFELDATVTANLGSSTLGKGLLIVKYENELGFLAGIIVGGSWSPTGQWSVLSNLSLTTEGGVFLSTISQSDLSAFDHLNFPYLPEKIDPGLTFLGSVVLENSLAAIQKILPSNTQLNLYANLPLGTESGGTTVIASLTESTTQQSIQFKSLSLTWTTSNPQSGSITIAAEAAANYSGDTVDIIGSGTFTYGTSPALALSLEVEGTGAWTHPFGIQTLTIKDFIIGLVLNEEGVGLDIQGTIEVGTGESQPVLLTVGVGVEDFELPSYVQASLSAENPNAAVTLPHLVQDFIPELDLTKVPLLNQITFNNLSFLAVAAEVVLNDKTYYPGIGATGDITFFGYNLDFAFTLQTNPVAIKALGVISQNGGPIVISAGSIQILKISDVSGSKGPSACVDTTGSDFCKAVGAQSGAYFFIDAAVNFLGLSASILAQATAQLFEFQLTLAAGNIFSAGLTIEFAPQSNVFAAAASMDFNPPAINFPSVGIIPAFSIPTPQIDFCVALGTVVPTAAPCADGWMPSTAPYFHLELKFSWASIDFDLVLDLEIGGNPNAFSSFSDFVVQSIFDNGKILLQFILAAAKLLAQLLLKLGEAFYDVLKAIWDGIQGNWQKAFEDVKEAYEALFGSGCSMSDGDSALNSSSSVAFEQHPAVLAQMAELPGAQDLLYHYYLNAPELESRLKGNSDLAANVKNLRTSFLETPESKAEKPIPLVMDAIRAISEGASPQFKASAAEVLPILEAHREDTYSGFLAALAA